jgi:hypothetical protein
VVTKILHHGETLQILLLGTLSPTSEVMIALLEKGGALDEHITSDACTSAITRVSSVCHTCRRLTWLPSRQEAQAG